MFSLLNPHSVSCLPFFINLFILFILFWAVLGLRCYTRAFSSCREQGLLFIAARASHCSGFFCCGAWALGAQASVVVARGLRSCGSGALECRLSSCGTRAYLLRSMWDLPGPGLEPMSPALAGVFLTTAPPGEPHVCLLTHIPLHPDLDFYLYFCSHIRSYGLISLALSRGYSRSFKILAE